jgi:hypothetical protein
MEEKTEIAPLRFLNEPSLLETWIWREVDGGNEGVVDKAPSRCSHEERVDAKAG